MKGDKPCTNAQTVAKPVTVLAMTPGTIRTRPSASAIAKRTCRTKTNGTVGQMTLAVKGNVLNELSGK